MILQKETQIQINLSVIGIKISILLNIATLIEIQINSKLSLCLIIYHLEMKFLNWSWLTFKKLIIIFMKFSEKDKN